MTAEQSRDPDVLQELDQLARFARKPRSRPFAPVILTPDAVTRLTEQAKVAGPEVFKRARQEVLAAHALVSRDTELSPLAGRIRRGLSGIIERIIDGELTVPRALPEARSVLGAALTDAYVAGAQTIDPEYGADDLPDDDAADLTDRISEETSYLTALLAAAAAGTLDFDAIDRRLTLWAAQTRGAYEQGKGAGALSLQDAGNAEDADTVSTRGSRHRLIGAAIGGTAALAGSYRTDEEPSFIWIAVGDKDTCDYCGEQDGQEFTVSELDDIGWPGDGNFGDSPSGCSGGPQCRCICIPAAGHKAARPRLVLLPD